MIRKIMLFLTKRADKMLIDVVLQTALKRKEELFPEWEIVYLALPRNDRKKRLDYLAWILQKELERSDV